MLDCLLRIRSDPHHVPRDGLHHRHDGLQHIRLVVNYQDSHGCFLYSESVKGAGNFWFRLAGSAFVSCNSPR